MGVLKFTHFGIESVGISRSFSGFSYSSKNNFLSFCCSCIMLDGIRIVLELSFREDMIACLIHHTAYEINLIFLLGSNCSAALIKPMLPSEIRSGRSNP